MNQHPSRRLTSNRRAYGAFNHEAPRSRKPIVVTTAVALGIASIVGGYGLLFRSTNTTTTPAPTTTAASKSAATVAPDRDAAKTTPQAEVFARWVAGELFDWDTKTTQRNEVSARLLAVSIEDELNGLAADVGNYLPDAATWQTLSELGVRQWLDIESAVVPEEWATAIASAEPEAILPGTTAYTITGTRHREGHLDGQPQTYSAPVAFTIS